MKIMTTWKWQSFLSQKQVETKVVNAKNDHMYTNKRKETVMELMVMFS